MHRRQRRRVANKCGGLHHAPSQPSSPTPPTLSLNPPFPIYPTHFKLGIIGTLISRPISNSFLGANGLISADVP